MLRHGAGTVPVTVAASEMAIHIIETGTDNAGVSSYNRVVRFDRVDGESDGDGGDVTIGLCAYVGRRPVAEMIGLGMGFPPSELAFYVLRIPMTPDGAAVVGRAQAGFDSRGVPEHAHSVRRFLY